MQSAFVCYTCHKEPTQFTILSCDHIICSTCLDTNMATHQNISIVQCLCGMKTFCDEESMRMSLRTPEMAQVKDSLCKINKLHQDQQQNTKISNFFIHQHQHQQQQQYDQQTGFASLLKEGIIENASSYCLANKNNNRCTQNLHYVMMNSSGNGYSRLFLKTEPLNVDEKEVVFVRDGQQGMGFGDLKRENGNGKCMVAAKGVQTIIPMTESEKVSLNNSPRNSVAHKQHNHHNYNNSHQKIKKQPIQRLYQSPVLVNHHHNINNFSSSHTSQQQQYHELSQQLQKQFKFLSIQYQRQLQHCEKVFNKIIRKINSQFEKLLCQLQQYYLENIGGEMAMNNIEEKFEVVMSMPQVIKRRYEKMVGRRLGGLNEKLLSCLVNQNTGGLHKKPSYDTNLSKTNNDYYYNERETRQTIQLTKDNNDNTQIIANIITNNSNKKNNNQNSSTSTNKKSKSKQKECRLYLAINPKKKNDKIINYIDVIRKSPVKNLKKNTIKKSFKLNDNNSNNSKLRIY